MKKRNAWSKPSRELDGDSCAALTALENGDQFERAAGAEREKKKLQKAAENYFRKDARVSFRVSRHDLDGIKRMAAEKGLPYQTYLTSVIHQLTTGQMSFR